MKRIIGALLAVVALAGVAHGQSFTGRLQAGRVLGNSTAAERAPMAATLTAMFDRAYCSTDLSVVARAAGAWACATAASDLQVLRRSGTAIGFGSIDISNSAVVGTSRLQFGNLAQGSARSVLGVTGNSTADVASIQGTTNQVLVVNNTGTALSFGPVNLTSGSAVNGTLPVGNGGTGVTSSTGTGNVVLSNSPTLVTPALGAATATTINGATLDNNAWNGYSPTISCTSGTITTSTISVAKWKQIGKTTIIIIVYSISSLGTCTGDVNFTFPGGISPVNTNVAGNGYITTTDAACVVKISTIPSLQFVAGSTAQGRAATFIFEAS